ncbi:MAG: tRNA pseudouridine(55) synthase TruB [bacterium]|nr:tRNA pseudouridine(55) synthase TruB [bacterium]
MHGVLNINKEAGMTSFDVVSAVKRLLKLKRVGHTGTLDPEATGVLVVCLGKATKIIPFLNLEKKEYLAKLKLGIKTTTQDKWGEITESIPGVVVNEARVKSVMKTFVGEIEQIPPMYSALHHQGERLYKLAREGLEVERRPRKVNIYELVYLGLSGGPSRPGSSHPEVTFRAVVSTGTYLRTLCADMGDALGSGGHLSFLTRTRVGAFKLAEAVTLSQLKEAKEAGNITGLIYSMDEALSFLPVVKTTLTEAKLISHGRPIEYGMRNAECGVHALPDSSLVRVHSPTGQLLAVGKVNALEEDVLIRPVRVFV